MMLTIVLLCLVIIFTLSLVAFVFWVGDKVLEDSPSFCPRCKHKEGFEED